MPLTQLRSRQAFALSPDHPAYATVSAEIAKHIGREDLTLADEQRGARQLRERLWADPHRPRYHLLPPDGFWNDVNGAIYWKGRYHLFFLGRQSPDRDTILGGKDTLFPREIWLHASSADLVHWIWHPTALLPVFDGSMPQGIYSGGAVAGAPIPTLIYHVPGQGICISTAEDDELIKWTPSPHNPVISETKSGNSEYIVFDPCAWREGEVYYALVGNKNTRPGYEGDATSLFKSTDLIHWEYQHPFYKSDRKWTGVEYDAACPDFFPIGGKHMLVTHVHRPLHMTQYYLGSYANERFYPEQHGLMSWPGGQMSGPETLLDASGRRILWGWLCEAKPNENGWGSVASLPRILSLAPDDTLRITPAPELEMLRADHQAIPPLTLAAGKETVLPEINGDCLELALTLVLPAGHAEEAGVRIRRSPDGEEQTSIVYAPREQTLTIDVSRASLDPKVKYEAISLRYAKETHAPTEQRFTTRQVAPLALAPGESLRLRIFLDRSVLEVFANERQCITQRIYPTRPDSRGVSLFSKGAGLRAEAIHAWRMIPTNSW